MKKMMEKGPMPFDIKRMVYGGFKFLVDASATGPPNGGSGTVSFKLSWLGRRPSVRLADE